jgi:hypothetical protein
MSIDFKTASDHVVDSYMQSQGLDLLDPTTIPRDQATGLYALAPIVAYVTEKDKNQANEALRRTLKQENEIKAKCFNLQINGSGKEIWAADLPTIVELIMVLPGKRAKQFRRVCANYIVRILGGDRTLIKEIENQDEMLNQTEAGRQFQENALASAGVSQSAIDMREREAKVARMEMENTRMKVENMQMADNYLQKLKRTLEEAGAWGPQNEKMLLSKAQHTVQFLALGSSTNDVDNSDTLYAIGPYMSKNHPEYTSKDNYKALGAITAFLFRCRYRPEDVLFVHLKSKDHDEVLRKKFFRDDVTKNGTSQCSAKAYESYDQDLIEYAFMCTQNNISLNQIKQSISKLGEDWWQTAIESQEAFGYAVDDMKTTKRQKVF